MKNILAVARAAGVSATTVSHALNGKGRVSKETRERVEKAALDLGYRANVRAVGFRTGSSRLIALQIASDMIEVTLPNSTYFTELLNGASQAAMEAGWLVAVIPSTIDVGIMDELGIECGIAVDPTGSESLLSFLNERGGLVVTTGRPPADVIKALPNLLLSYVDNDIKKLTFSGLDHLMAAGYKCPALLTVNSRKSYVNDIITAYEIWCAAGGCEAIVARASNLNEPHAARTAERLLSQAPRPDAIFTTNEGAAHGVIKAARKMGLSIPDDVGLIATMPLPRIIHSMPSMTAIDPNAYEIGRTAVRTLMQKMNDPSSREMPKPVPFLLRSGTSTSRFMIKRSHGN